MPIRILGLLLVALALGLPARAADDPPPWRGEPLSTTQQWTFSTPPPNYPKTTGPDTESQPPTTSSNPYAPTDYVEVTGFSARGLRPPSMQWVDALFGVRGVWRVAPVEWEGTPWGFLEFGITNAGRPGHTKEVRVQITAQEVTGPPEVYVTERQPEPQYWANVPWTEQRIHPNPPAPGWTHRSFTYHLPDCPTYETLSIYPPGGGVVYVDHVVVDTICRPVAQQQGTGLQIPGGDERLGLHLAPGVDPRAVLQAHGLTAERTVPVPGGGTLVSVRAAGAVKDALARDGRVRLVAGDPCREMLQGGVRTATDDECDKTQTLVRGKVQGSGVKDDPVNTYTGELFFHEPPDLALGGPIPLVFQRYYASGLDGPPPVEGVVRDGGGRRAAAVAAVPSFTPEAFVAGAAPAWDPRPLSVTPAGADGRFGPLAVHAGAAGRLGTNWRHSFDWALQRVGGRAVVVTPEGRAFEFARVRAGWRQGSALDTPAQLVESEAAFIFASRASGPRHVFDRAGRLARIEDGRGDALTLGYRGGRLVEIADGLGRRLALAYDGDGRLIEVGDGTRVVRFGYSGRLLVQATDALGAVTRYRYDDPHARAGLLVAVVRPNGNSPYTQTYDAAGRVATQTDAAGHTTRFAYAPGVTTITDPAGRTVRHAHDAAGRLVAVTDEAGRRVTVGHDAVGRRGGITDRLGDTTRATYHEPSGALASIRQADGATTAFEYAVRRTGGIEAHDLVRVTRADGATERFAYDPQGNLVDRTDAAGQTWRYAYDARGRLVTATEPAGATTRYAYHPDGTLASVTDPAGNVTVYEVDALRRLSRVRLPDGASRTNAYDARDRLVALTDERGQTTRYGYDANGNLTSVTGPLAAATRLAYDAMDRPVEATGPDGGRTRVAYTERGRVSAWTRPDGSRLAFEYEARGRPAALIGPAGERWIREHDAEGVLTASTDPLGGVRRYESDRLGRLTRLTGRDGHAIELTYDRLGRLVAARDALGPASSRTYDPRGLLTGIGVGNGALETRYAWDASGRLTEVLAPSGQRWQWTYDPQGRPSGARDPLGRTVGLAHDARGRVAAITLPAGLGRVALGYDPAGQLVSRRHPDGSELRYEYDAAGRLTRADGLTLRYDASGRLVESNGLALGYDADGKLTRVALAPGKAIEHAYDRAGRLAEVRDWLGGRTSFAYDAAGRLVRLVRPNGVTTSFARDPEGRVVGIQEGTLARIALTRDARGRVTAAERTQPLAAATGPGQRRFAFDAASQTAGFGHDALGRLTKDDRRSYEWDGASRLRRYTEAGRTVAFTYDGLGQRLSRRGDGAAREYVWNYGLGLPSIAVEREAGADRVHYVHTPDGALLYRIDARDGRRRFYHFDEPGNTTFLTDDRGALTAAYAYTPYGVPLAARDDPDNPFTWGGRLGVMREGASGLYYLRARYYDGATGRFLSPDPVPGLGPRTVNPYQYARGNPLRYVDPSGLQPNADASRPAGDKNVFPPRLTLPWKPDFSPRPSGGCSGGQREVVGRKHPTGLTLSVGLGRKTGLYTSLDALTAAPTTPQQVPPATPPPQTAEGGGLFTTTGIQGGTPLYSTGFLLLAELLVGRGLGELFFVHPDIEYFEDPVPPPVEPVESIIDEIKHVPVIC